jgi:hypothetical protein
MSASRERPVLELINPGKPVLDLEVIAQEINGNETNGILWSLRMEDIGIKVRAMHVPKSKVADRLVPWHDIFLARQPATKLVLDAIASCRRYINAVDLVEEGKA